MSTQPREIVFGETARTKLREGIDQLADVVGVTLGPAGCNVAYESWQVSITRDGKTIVGEVELKDQFQNMGVQLGREAANKVRELCGDGTTTAIVLLRALVAEGVKMIAAGASPIGLKRGMDKAVQAVEAALLTSAKQITEPTEIRDIATVSAAGQREIGTLIAEAFERVGRRGVITVEKGKSFETTIEVVEGLRFDRGYASPYFCTSPESMVAELQDPAVLVVEGEIQSIQELIGVLQGVAASGKELLIIADDFKGEVLPTLVVNRLRGTLKVVAVKSPGFGDQRKAMLQDIAILTGATLVAGDAGVSLRDAGLEVLGAVERATVTKDKTTLIGGAGAPEQIRGRIQQLEAEAERAANGYDKDKLKERAAKLTGGVAVIRVGASTEAELEMRKQVFQDSLNSTWSALAKGVVPGGGVALLRAAEAARSQLHLEGDEALGARLVYSACQAPVKQLAANSSADPSVILALVMAAPEKGGFNVLSGKVEEDLPKVGVIGSVLNDSTALKVAASTAGVVLLSESLIGDAEEEEAL